MNNTARILITCPDKPGIVAAVSNFLYSHNVNIIDLDQHSTDHEDGVFFMRLEFHTPYLDLTREALEDAFEKVVAERFNMNWRMSYGSSPKKVALMVSGHDHCLMELLWRFKRGEMPCVIGSVIGNYPDHKESVEAFGIPYHYIPTNSGDQSQAEAKAMEVLNPDVDLIVLARYMKVLSPDFVSRFPNRIINIHHSFLPAFPGADPYGRAYERGVKIIGATAHYVIEELDAGPIIEQATARVTHRNSVEDMRALGRELERMTLARAVKWHLEDRLIVYGNKTVVFA